MVQKTSPDICITGASGFIGKNLVLALPESRSVHAFYHANRDFPAFLDTCKKPNVVPVRANLLNQTDLEQARIQGDGFNTVIYLAANGDPTFSVQHAGMDLDMNTRALINFIETFCFKRIIYFSSGAVYDGLSGLVDPLVRLDPLLPYAVSKYASEQYIRHFARHRGFEFIVVRFFGAFGYYEPPRKMFTRIINELHFKGKDEYVVRGDGTNLVDALFIDDVIRAIITMIDSPPSNLVIDFGGCAPVTVNEIVRAGARAVGKPGITVRHEGQTAEPIRFRISNKAMEKYYSFTPTLSLEQGFSLLFEFLKKHPPVQTS